MGEASKTDQSASMQSPNAGAAIETDGGKQGESAVPVSNYWVRTRADELPIVGISNCLLSE